MSNALNQCYHSLYRSAASMLSALAAGNDRSISCGFSAGSGWLVTEFGCPELSTGSGCPGLSAGSAVTSSSSSPICCVVIYYLSEETHTLPLLSI